MNIYLMNEDSEQFCIMAKTMAEAINICESSYLDDRKEEETDRYNVAAERSYYHEEILQSCSLVGKLKNYIGSRTAKG